MVSEILTIGKITGLALADSVNPCALAVLAMVLMEILLQNPEKKRRVLYAGLAFVSSVFVGYLVYGLIIIQLFMGFAQFLRTNAALVNNGLAIMAMVLGALNIKDFLFYKKGSFATEMPIAIRPKLKKVIERITSPKGAFVIGFLVTLFLLPCTMGPYIVASGILSELGTLGALPWLLYYNFLFVIPMLIIVGLIYYGVTRIEDVANWKDKNIKILHLIAGVLLFLTGLALLMGWFY